jgi:hypothetical protein
MAVPAGSPLGTQNGRSGPTMRVAENLFQEASSMPVPQPPNCRASDLNHRLIGCNHWHVPPGISESSPQAGPTCATARGRDRAAEVWCRMRARLERQRAATTMLTGQLVRMMDRQSALKQRSSTGEPGRHMTRRAFCECSCRVVRLWPLSGEGPRPPLSSLSC